MKALINILSRLLLLLILATACARDLDTEIDSLEGKDEVQLTVNMQVSGLKVATRADGGETLTDITALCFNENGGLEKKETVIDIGASTFKIYVPKETKNIHFLANLPEGYSLDGVASQSDLAKLTTTDKSKLSYWGMTTFNGTDKSLHVYFYRNMAMITIAPGEDAAFTQKQLSIAGVVNGYNTGMLVPNRDVNQNISFDFSLSGEYDYYTLPTTDYTLIDDDADKAYDATAYVFEHPNEPNTLADALHVICKIGDYYYKVALAYEDQQGEYQNYSIIRNHKYVIYVSDVCDVPQNLYSSNYNDVLSYDPINMEVVDVALSAVTQTSQLYFDGTSTKEMQVDVTIPPGVANLNISAKDFSSVKVDETSLSGSNGVYTYTFEASETEQKVTFTFTLNTGGVYNDNQSSEITFSDAAQGSLVEDALVSITLKKTPVVQLSIQQQPQLTNSTLYYSETSREEFTMDVNVPAGVERLQITAEDFDVSWATDNGVEIGTAYEISDTQNNQTVRLMFTLKEGVSSTDSPSAITITGTGDYVIVNNTLTTTITLQESAAPAEGSILNWQGAVVMDYEKQHMTKIPIFYDDLKDLLPGSKIQVDYTTNGGWVRIYYPYALNGEQNQWDDVTDNTDELNDKELVLTETILNNIEEHKDAAAYNHEGVGLILQGSNNSVLTKITIVPAKESIEATITSGETLYYDADNQTTTVQVTVPAGVETLNIEAADFSSVTADGGYTVNGDANSGYSVSLTEEGEKQINFTFRLDISKYSEETESTSTTITFSDGADNSDVQPDNVIVNLEKTPVSEISATSQTIDMDSDQTSTTITLTKPSSVYGVNVNITDANGASANTKFSITMNNYTLNCNNDQFETINNGAENIPLVFAVIDENISAGVYTVTFTDAYNNQTTPGSTTITVVNTPSLQFEYDDNTTLYLDGGDGSPTTLLVTITVPVGSSLTELNITATGFTVTASSEGLSGSEGSYTYTGVSTTFTFVPTTTSATRIKFTGSGTNLKEIDETISVTVEDTKPAQGEEVVIWTPEEGSTGIPFGSWYKEMLLKGSYTGEKSGLVENYKEYFVAGATIKVEFKAENANSPSLILSTNGDYGFDETVKDNLLSYTFITSDFSEEGQEQNVVGHGLYLEGQNVIVTKISIIPASTTE